MLNMMVKEGPLGKEMYELQKEELVTRRAFQAGKHEYICSGYLNNQSVGFQETSRVLTFPF